MAPVSADELIAEIKRPVEEALENRGLTLDFLVSKLHEELEAEETKFFAFEGQVVDKKDVISWPIRQRARQDAHKLRGDYAPERQEHSGRIVVETVNYAETKSVSDKEEAEE